MRHQSGDGPARQGAGLLSRPRWDRQTSSARKSSGVQIPLPAPFSLMVNDGIRLSYVDTRCMKLFGVSFGTLNAQLAATFMALAGMISLGTVTYHSMEGWSWTSSFYFTVCTITTVGYGDMVPSTETSRLVTALFALAGVSIAFASFGIIGATYIRRGEDVVRKVRRED